MSSTPYTQGRCATKTIVLPFLAPVDCRPKTLFRLEVGGDFLLQSPDQHLAFVLWQIGCLCGGQNA
jgi:hypothetical protein